MSDPDLDGPTDAPTDEPPATDGPSAATADEPPVRVATPDTGPPAFRRVDPRMRRLWFVDELFRVAFLGGGALALDHFVLSSRLEGWPVPHLWVGGAVVLVLLLWACVAPGLQYRCWRYAVREHDVLLVYGVLWRVRRSVPRLRIQHVDVHAGPLTRLCGLVHLTLFTAGTGDADAAIPGLLPHEAESLRDDLLTANARDAVERRAEDLADVRA